jgi:hypothetical protein
MAVKNPTLVHYPPLHPIIMPPSKSKKRAKTFAEAKIMALKCLDACPMDVLQRFINKSWRFMSAYRWGLTEKAAEWVFRRQRGRRSVSEAAYRALEADFLSHKTQK